MGWLVDPDDETILVVDSNCRVRELKNNDRLPVLKGVELEVTVQKVFSWI